MGECGRSHLVVSPCLVTCVFFFFVEHMLHPERWAPVRVGPAGYHPVVRIWMLCLLRCVLGVDSSQDFLVECKVERSRAVPDWWGSVGPLHLHAIPIIV